MKYLWGWQDSNGKDIYRAKNGDGKLFVGGQ